MAKEDNKRNGTIVLTHGLGALLLGYAAGVGAWKSLVWLGCSEDGAKGAAWVVAFVAAVVCAIAGVTKANTDL